jgi:hypothetical protein
MDNGGALAIFVIVGLVLFGITVWGVVDALQRPDAVWAAAGQNKTTWVVLMIVLAFLCGLGWVVALIYLLSIRPKLIAAASGGMY